MTQEEAEKLGQVALDAGFEGLIVPLGKGDGSDACLKILIPHWHCFSPGDLTRFLQSEEARRYCETVRRMRSRGRRSRGVAIGAV